MVDGTRGDFAIVTGATGGMGRAIAGKLAEQGFSLLLADLDATALERCAGGLDGPVKMVAADIAEPNFCERLLDELPGKIGALVHCAGLSPSMATGERILEVNFHATRRLIDALLPRMAPGSCAVLISSMAPHIARSPEMDAAVEALVDGGESDAVQRFASSPQGAYPLSKGAVTALVARQAAAFGALGARIVSLSPGSIDTPMGRTEQSAGPAIDAMLQRTPLGRMGTPEEIADVAAFLCSEKASYITGCDIRVDGGILAALGK